MDNNYSEAFILKKHWKTKKIGVNEAEDQEIIDALLSAAKTISHHSQSINIEQYNSLNLNSYAIRMKLCDKLKIPYCNHKQLFKRLNMLNINLKELKKIINNLK